jgi:chemotaxis protein CheD
MTHEGRARLTEGEGWADATGRRSVYLHPGQVLACREPTLVTTVLGSCVAVCLWDPTSCLGGINHYLLPYWAGGGLSSARFGNVAIRELVDGLLGLGARRTTLAAKVFGGACVFDAFDGNGRQHLGAQNVERAVSLLEDEGIPIVAADTGGRRGRKLVFRSDDGAVWLRAI